MKSELRYLSLLVLVSTSFTVIMEPKEHITLDDEHSYSFNEVLALCLAKKEHGTFECVNRGILSTLQSLNDKDSLEFGKMRLDRAEGYGRDLLDLDYDPKDFGNVVKAAARLMERRNVKWNLDNIYPGLQMRIGPMLNGNGILEFVVNERVPSYGDRQTSTDVTCYNQFEERPLAGSTIKTTRLVANSRSISIISGRQLTRHILLPFLLGFKFNLASLIPLMFGFLLIVTKKALLLTKMALFLIGLLGWNTLFSGAPAVPPYSANAFNGFHAYGHDTPAGVYTHYDYHYPQRPYRPLQDYSPYDQHVIREVVNVYDGNSDSGQSKQNKRNFVFESK
ncbi:hypothetical protein ALC56_05718 [Trachymyrmex septentrionalis]|uniref:Osiris 10 n=1 Tax=Trachymyrmex septentrionalis TaxID=34720 RepID=A0A195FGY8_9HYME|nr:hypothetical protein ALC56_05718 [Trachymyrmex septentrionalis]